jgi:hypothetical protein
LRALLVFELFLGTRQIDLAARMDCAKVLSHQEVEKLVSVCRLPTATLSSALAAYGAIQSPVARRPATPSLEKHRARRRQAGAAVVSPAVASTRLRSVCSYLSWLISCRLYG